MEKIKKLSDVMGGVMMVSTGKMAANDETTKIKVE